MNEITGTIPYKKGDRIDEWRKKSGRVYANVKTHK